ncbi:MAG TPA: glycosyltransferase family 2 protein [Candidatus Pacearchaeota archaeon]|nr:glycosyltransferase family 2 protein [Candidatus Pacearchaeota archaeon]
MENKSYLSIGKASDIENKKERRIYRFFEMLPGLLSWSVLFLAVFCSWKIPFITSIFIISFSLFWLLRTIYYSFHLWSGYQKMKKIEKADWIKKLNSLSPSKYSLKTIKNWKELYHLIVIPMYKEELEILKDTFSSLEKSNYPKEKMIVVLGCEERNKEEAQKIASEIEKEFGKKFFRFLITWHPQNLKNEINGKGANETWAAKKAKKEIIDPLKIPYENIIFSSFDADTCVFPQYFTRVSYCFLTVKKPLKTSYQPIPLFINNIWQAPIVSQVFSFSSTFWHTINQERANKLITFSSHSMSFKTLIDVNFKQTNVVSDDSRIFWQCFLKFDGNYRVKPLYYPISMDANVSKNLLKTMINIYKQQRRWAYGVGDIAYFLFGFLKNKKIPIRKEISLGWELIEGHIEWATASLLIFFIGWLPLLLGGPQFSQTVLSYNLPKIISRLMTISMIGLVFSAYLSFLLLPPKPPSFSKYKYIIWAFSWLLFPFIMVFFTSFPALDAQTRWLLGKYMGFWTTEKVRK